MWAASPNRHTLQQWTVVRVTVHEICLDAMTKAGVSPETKLSMESGAPALLRYLREIEQSISGLLHRYGRRFLLVALQAGVPEALLSPPAGYEGDMQELYNRTSVIAYKHGVDDEAADIGLTQQYCDDYLSQTGDLSCFEPARDDLAMFWSLCMIYDSTLKSYRCLGKGADVVFPAEEEREQVGVPQVIVDEDTQRMMDLYDLRLIRDLHLLGSEGFPAPLTEGGPLPVPLMCINFPAFARGEWPAPPCGGMISAYPLYIATLMRNHLIAHRFQARVQAEELFCFHSAVLSPIADQLREGTSPPGIGGFAFAQRDELIALAAENGPDLYADVFNMNSEIWPADRPKPPFILESLVQAYWREVAPALLSASCYGPEMVTEIDPVMVGHSPTHYLFQLSDETFFIHCGLVQWSLQTLWDEYPHDGEEARLRGQTFEENLACALTAVGWDQVWPISKQLRGTIGRKTETDVDVLAAKGDVAVLIQCKAHKRNAAQHRGESQACWERWQDVQGWIAEIDEVAEFVATNPKECDLPTGITHLVPAVCTGVPEYFWSPDEHLFLPGEQSATAKTAAYRQPRVATIEELAVYLGSMADSGLDALRCDPNTRAVRWGAPL